MEKASIHLGNQRLLALADRLEKVDEEHRKRGEPPYRQTAWQHGCGTPACALGHYAAMPEAIERGWRLDRREGVSGPGGIDLWRGADLEFGLDPRATERTIILGGDSDRLWPAHLTDASELFGMNGCGCARTGKEAAAYIRKFVAKRCRTPDVKEE